MSSSGRLLVYPPSEYAVTYSADVSIPASSVSTETPRQTVSSFDHLVTQWMSRVISSLGRARNSSQVQPRGSSSSPAIEKSHSPGAVCGVGPADRTGKSAVTYWPGGNARDRRRRGDGPGTRARQWVASRPPFLPRSSDHAGLVADAAAPAGADADEDAPGQPLERGRGGLDRGRGAEGVLG